LIAAYTGIKDEPLLTSFEMLLRRIQRQYRTYPSLLRVPELGVPSGFKETGLARQGYGGFMKLIDMSLSLTEQARKAVSLDQELEIWQQVFGSEFPRKLI
jgi:hypothetical protein